MSIRRILTILVIAAAAFAALYVFYWIYVSGQIKEQTLAWAEERRAEGYAIEMGRVDVNGFPAAFDVQVTDFAIGAPNNDWSAATRALHARPASVFDLEVWDAQPESEVRAVIGSDEGPLELSLEGARLLLQSVDGEVVRTEAYLDSAELTSDQSYPVIDALGRRIEDVEIFLSAEDLDAGEVIIDSAQMSWGALDVSAAGVLGVDPAGFLAGTGQLGLSDPERFLDALQQAGILDNRARQFAQIAVAIAPRNEEDRVVLPVSFNGGKAYIGPAPVGAAPRIHAPETNS